MKIQQKQDKILFKNARAFSLVEMMLVLSMILAVGALTTPVAVELFNKQENQSAAEEIVTTLKKAQTFALLRKADSDFGVKFNNDNLALFQGSYIQGDINNQVSSLYRNSVELEPAFQNDEIVFTKGTGHTSARTITVKLNKFIKKIYICDNGLVDYDECE